MRSLALRKPPPEAAAGVSRADQNRGSGPRLGSNLSVILTTAQILVYLGAAVMHHAQSCCNETGETRSPETAALGEPTPLAARVAASGIQPTLCVRIFVGMAAISLSARTAGSRKIRATIMSFSMWEETTAALVVCCDCTMQPVCRRHIDMNRASHLQHAVTYQQTQLTRASRLAATPTRGATPWMAAPWRC